MDALAMGQYGAYVWTSYGLALLVMIACIVQARRRQQRVFRDIAQRLDIMEPNE
ncbi:MAG TPA: heme exporter protein CcmD [Woeseiaceae bacterium]|nr:heme exporter protein CcmD [Woeseiaceae bacterium]